jgi:hypothetical protein
MTQVSNFITKHWLAIFLFYIIVNSYTRLDNNQLALANRIDKIDLIDEKVEQILIRVERIDERTKNVGQENIKKTK